MYDHTQDYTFDLSPLRDITFASNNTGPSYNFSVCGGDGKVTQTVAVTQQGGAPQHIDHAYGQDDGAPAVDINGTLVRTSSSASKAAIEDTG